MTSRFTELAIDCHDPERLAAFWCEVLDFKVIDRSEGKVEIGSWVPTVEDVRARQMPPTLVFIRVPEGKTVKNRLHLDVRVGTGLVGDERVAALEAECERLTALGASKVRLMRADGVNESCLVRQDPEGTEFCRD